jgi:hypothetical protein
MITLSTIRRLTLGSVAALAILPLTAGVATAAGHDDLCAMRDEAPEEFDPLFDALAEVIAALCDGTEDDGDDGDDGGDGDETEDGPTGTPLDELLALLEGGELDDLLGTVPTDELCALQDEAPEEFAPILEALAPLIDELCPAEDPEPEPEEEPEPEPTPETEPQEDEQAVGAPASDPTLPDTGGGAALAGLALLGAAGTFGRVVRARG